MSLSGGGDAAAMVNLSAFGRPLQVCRRPPAFGGWRTARRSWRCRAIPAVWDVALSADGHLLASGSFDGMVKLWETNSGTCLRTLRSERRYERMDMTGLTGITDAERAALLALGAVEQHGPAGEACAATPLTSGR